MSQAVITRPVGTGRTSTRTTMTCDIPVVAHSRESVRTRRSDGELCRPSGRDPRRSNGAERPAETARRREAAYRPADVRTVETVRSNAAPRSNTAVRPLPAAVVRRRRIVGAALLGGALAGLVWTVAIIGGAYEDAVTPQTPSVTQVVHVRSGESLTDVARRIAPDLPTAGVVAQLREMNGLETSGLRVSQALVAPAY